MGEREKGRERGEGGRKRERKGRNRGRGGRKGEREGRGRDTVNFSGSHFTEVKMTCSVKASSLGNQSSCKKVTSIHMHQLKQL